MGEIMVTSSRGELYIGLDCIEYRTFLHLYTANRLLSCHCNYNLHVTHELVSKEKKTVLSDTF